jgi:hypothetical protein
MWGDDEGPLAFCTNLLRDADQWEMVMVDEMLMVSAAHLDLASAGQ